VIETYLRAVRERPDDWLLKRNFGSALLAFDRTEEAARWLESAYAMIPDHSDTLYPLCVAYQRLGKEGELKDRLRELELLEPRYPGLEALKK